MADSKGFYDKEDLIPFLIEGSNWTWFKKILALCIEEGKPGHFLDIGAGLGFFVECCSRFGIKCTGIEGSQFGVIKAKERDIDLIHFIIDKTPLPFAAESISTVLMSEFIEHVPKKIAMFILSECYRVLEKKGVIIILTPSRYNPKANKEPQHINLYSKDTIKEEVVNAGFHFEKYIKDSPRTILTHTSFEYFLMRQIYRFYKPSFLSQSAACVAVKL